HSEAGFGRGISLRASTWQGSNRREIPRCARDDSTAKVVMDKLKREIRCLNTGAHRARPPSSPVSFRGAERRGISLPVRALPHPLRCHSEERSGEESLFPCARCHTLCAVIPRPVLAEESLFVQAHGKGQIEERPLAPLGMTAGWG